MPTIPVLRRLSQEYHEFESTLGYIVKSCLKQTNDRNRNRKYKIKVVVNTYNYGSKRL
jgi:hypothetical protein